MSPTNPSYHYVVLGAGRQGTAAAYDLARFGNAQQITLADMDAESARQSAERVNTLIGRQVAVSQQIDVRDLQALKTLLEPADGVLSAVPYFFNLEITKTAVATGTSVCDMGGHTETVRRQLALDAEARQAGISIVPDCGMGPGLNITMAAYTAALFDEPRAVYVFDGGLPQQPKPPWNYELTFHINGLTNELDGQAVFVRDGEVAYIDTLTEPEFIDFPPLGRLEADVTSGGTSLSPWSFAGKLQTYENKTLRYPGHFEWLRAFKQLGLFSENAIEVDGQQVVPRHFYHKLIEPQIRVADIRDICLVRTVGEGLADGKPRRVTVDLVDWYDQQTGFTAMERLTGWHCAIMLAFQVDGTVPPGGHPLELAVDPARFMQAVAQRGIQYQTRWSALETVPEAT